MKKILLAVFIIAGSFIAEAQEIKWMTMDEALAAQKKDPKPIFLDVYTDWCGPCKTMDQRTFRDKGVSEFISGVYYAVKFNAEGNSEVTYKGIKYSNPEFIKNHKGKNSTHDFTKFLKVQAYPTMYIFNADGEIVTSIMGLRTAKDLIKEL